MTKQNAGEFGNPTGPGFADLRTANGQLVVAALSEWRQYLDQVARDTPDENLGWLRSVYLVPAALARSWASFYSLDRIAQHDWAGRKLCRLRGIVKLDDRNWTPISQDPLDDEGKGHTALCELIGADTIEGGPLTYAERVQAEWKRKLGSNFFATGPIYPKAGKEQYAMGYNVRVLAVNGLRMGQWFKVQLPPAPTW